jgi:hypothetical protein
VRVGLSSTFTSSNAGGASDATTAIAWDWLGWWPWLGTTVSADAPAVNMAGRSTPATSTHTRAG